MILQEFFNEKTLAPVGVVAGLQILLCFNFAMHADIITKSRDTFYMNIGNKITELRKQENLSETDFAKTVGVSRELIGRYERGEEMPSVEVAAKIADALEVSLDYLAGNSKNAAVDKQTIKLIADIEDLEPSIRVKLIFLANA